jgi:lysyl-tRNA synthetase class 2
MNAPSPWWSPHVHADRRPLLAARGRITVATRDFFRARGFTEVESAVLQVSPGNEAHLHAFATDLQAPDGTRSRLYLHTSPEFACKKLLAAGERKIFDFARVFRNRESGALHHPEFTLLEWYRVEEIYDALMEDCAALLAAAAHAAGTRRLAFRDRIATPFAEPERMTVAQAFARFADVDLLATVSADVVDRDALATAAAKAGIRVAADDTWADVFSRVLVERIEPNLGVGRPTILYEYPVAEAALARPANGFGELTDAVEQRRRFEAEMAENERLHGERYPLDEDFLTALAAMPPASGVALGFDRLAMLLTGAQRIEQVLWTPVVERGNPM